MKQMDKAHTDADSKKKKDQRRAEKEMLDMMTKANKAAHGLIPKSNDRNIASSSPYSAIAAESASITPAVSLLPASPFK